MQCNDSERTLRRGNCADANDGGEGGGLGVGPGWQLVATMFCGTSGGRRLGCATTFLRHPVERHKPPPQSGVWRWSHITHHFSPFLHAYNIIVLLMAREEGGDSGLRGDGSRSALMLPYSAMAEGWYSMWEEDEGNRAAFSSMCQRNQIRPLGVVVWTLLKPCNIDAESEGSTHTSAEGAEA